MTGLKLALQSQSAKSIETEIRNDKNNLREQLFGSESKQIQNEKSSLFIYYPITPGFYPNQIKVAINSNGSIKEIGGFLYEKFQRPIQVGFDQYCLKKDLPKTEDQFIRYLVELELNSLVQLQQYTRMPIPDRCSRKQAFQIPFQISPEINALEFFEHKAWEKIVNYN